MLFVLLYFLGVCPVLFTYGHDSGIYSPWKPAISPVEPALDTLRKRIAFYNVENLFHPSDDSLTRDEEFTPEGSYYWSYYKYRRKLNALAKVLVALGEGNQPAVIGLCEVENRMVLEDLCNRTLLRSFRYNIIHQESKDQRGIDVALLYDPKVFMPKDYRAITITDENEKIFRTRDILRVDGSFYNKADCHIFVNHWPSRRGGKLASEPRRIQVAGRLSLEIDKITKEEREANIIIMGDFNDEPVDTSIESISVTITLQP